MRVGGGYVCGIGKKKRRETKDARGVAKAENAGKKASEDVLQESANRKRDNRCYRA